jgi:hypothetical protein
MKNISTLLKWLFVIIILAINLCTLSAQNVPELMYYKFNASGNQQNYASSPVGTNPAVLTGLTIGSVGQFGTALIGNATASNYLNTGWTTNLPSTGWTISMWIDSMPSNTNLYYLWGDVNATSFRCFLGGAAGAGNLYLRGGGLTDVLVTGVAPGPTVVHFVYDGSSIKVYLNGTLSSTSTQPTIAITGTGPFLVGAYSTLAGMSAGSHMDEFRMYNRALTQTEITATWNQMLPATGGDAGISTIVNPKDSICSGSQTVTVKLKNYYNKTLNSVKINWKVNNVAQTVYSWTGTLLPSDSVNVNLGAYNFLTGTSYTVKAYTSSPNNKGDSIAANDTMTKKGIFVIPAPSAIITPGGTSSICLGDSISLGANTGSGLTYQWKLGVTPIGGATGQSIFTKLAGSYTVVVTNAYGCPKTSVAVNVKVDTLVTPTATPAGATTFCDGGSVLINASTGKGLTYQWKKDGVNINGATTSSYTAITSGNYRVVVTKNSVCIDSSAAVVVNVIPLPSGTITPSKPAQFCMGDSVILNAITGTGFNYRWKKDGLIITGATASYYKAKVSGIYKVIITNSNFCVDSSAILVTVFQKPNATTTPGGPISICTGDSVTINANTTSGLTYQWRNMGVNIAGATNSSYDAKVAGSYKLVVIDMKGCMDSSNNIVVSVNLLPSATLTPAGSTTVCSGDSVLIKANLGAGLTYKWKKNGVIINGATDSSYIAKASGSYTVVVTNSSSCSATSMAVLVTVNPRPVATATANGPTSFCWGNSVVVKGNSGTGLTYQWNKNGLPISGETDSVITVNASGSYTFKTTLGTCSTLSSPVVVNVTTPNANLGKDTSVCADKSIVLDPGAGNTSYLWSTGATTPSITVDSSGVGLGTKTISVKATLNSCVKYDTIKITFVICAGIKQDITMNLIKVYPNPSAGTFTLELDGLNGIFEIRITDLAGKTAYVENITLNGTKSSRLIDLSSKPKGLYFLRMANKIEIRTEKIIIE